MKYKLITNHPVAYDSPDHKWPGGTMMDNSTNSKFNKKLYQLFPNQKISVVDCGCAGGGFVKSLIGDGHKAVGLEGSDYSLIRKRAEWATIPENLFTCDITKPFLIQEVCDGDECKNEACTTTAQFDVFTAWEVMEHIHERDLDQFIKNVKIHLKETGMWIMSVSLQVGPPHHQLVQHKEWWLKAFEKHGLVHVEDLLCYFGNDWVRGPFPGQNAPDSFHLILHKKTGS